MGFKDLFKKKEETVVDLSDMQKRGIYKPKQFEKKVDVIDLSTATGPTAASTTDEASPLGFLGSFAASTEPKNAEKEPEVSSIVLDTGKKQRLKGILRDLKVQANQNGDRVYKLAERIDLLEKKLDRIERRVGI